LDFFTSRNASNVDKPPRQAVVILSRRVKDIKLKGVLLTIRGINDVKVGHIAKMQCKEDILRMLVNRSGYPDEAHDQECFGSPQN
jgi:hypothetical protein